MDLKGRLWKAGPRYTFFPNNNISVRTQSQGQNSEDCRTTHVFRNQRLVNILFFLFLIITSGTGGRWDDGWRTDWINSRMEWSALESVYSSQTSSCSVYHSMWILNQNGEGERQPETQRDSLTVCLAWELWSRFADGQLSSWHPTESQASSLMVRWSFSCQGK